MKENWIIDGIEGRRRIQETSSRHLLLKHGFDDVIMNSKECRFSWMVLSVGRLKLVEQFIAGEVLSKPVFNYTLGESGQDW